MALLTADQIKDHIETDLKATAITRFISDAEEEIIKRFGAHATQTDTAEEVQLSNAIFLSRKAGSVVSVTETIDDTETVLASDDYELRHDGRVLQRLADGTNERSTWGDSVVVVYTPEDESNIRTRVLIDLVKLAIEYDTKKSTQVGDVRESSTDYETERVKILSRLDDFPFA